MSKLLTFEEFLFEEEERWPSLGKAYLCTARSSGQKWWSYKGFAGDKFFIQVTENNIDQVDLNQDYPVLNYQSSLVEKLLDQGRIKPENIYNHPDVIKQSGSKSEFHELVGDNSHVPKTVLTKRDALELAFPVIAKPASKHSGLGIQVFQDREELDKADEEHFDTYSEFIDKAEEHRFFCFRGEPFFWMERQPVNQKAKVGKGDRSEQMKFNYTRREIDGIPEEYATVLKEFCDIFEDFPFICFDMMKDKSGKVFVIESNAQPGVPFDSTVKMYERLYQDFYGEPVDQASKKRLDQLATEMISRTIEKDPKRFN